MPFVLHPSGFCAHFNLTDGNLLPGCACPECKRLVGHKLDCSRYVVKQDGGKSSRPKLFNAAAILWGLSPAANFITFTLPSISAGRYQRDEHCPETGDLIIGQKFSKLLEYWSVKTKRAGGRLSYVWVSERQKERGDKYGGAGEIHYHLLVNQQIKNDKNKVINPDLLGSLQFNWCNYLGVSYSSNCIDVKPLPAWVNSVPAYMAKYMGKGKQGPIFSRRFGATRDLTSYSPIHLTELPQEIDLQSVCNYTTAAGFEVSTYYYNTRQVLEAYAGEMRAKYRLKVTEPSELPSPAIEASRTRAIDRQRALFLR